MIGMGGPLLVTIAVLPLLIDTIGLDRFGVLALAWLVLTYFSQADFGLGRATIRRVAELGPDRLDLRARVVASAFAMMALGGVSVGFAAYLGGWWFFARELETSGTLREEMLDSLWLLAAAAPLVGLSGIASGSLTAVGRFKRVSLAQFVGGSGMQAFPLVAALAFGPDLETLIGAAVLSRLLALAILLPAVWQSFFRDTAPAWDGGEARRLIGFGKWIMLSALISPAMLVIDRFAIGALFGAAMVAIYTIPFQVASRLMVLPQAVMQVLFPHFARPRAGEAEGDGVRYVLPVALLFAPIVLVLLAFADPLLALWLGEGFDQRSVSVGRIVLAGFWVNAVAYVPYARIQAGGSPRFTGLLHLVEFPLYAALLVASGYAFGIIGMAVAFALRCSADAAALLWRDGSLGARVLLPVTAMLAIFAALILVDPRGWTASALAFVPAAIATTILMLTCLRDEAAMVLAHVRERRATLA